MSNTIPLIPVEPEAVIVDAVIVDVPSTIQERQQALSKRLDEVRAHNARLANDEKRLEQEIASVKEGLSVNRRRLPMAKMMVASPCDVPWAQMAGDERKRFCGSCEKHVHNLSEMTTAEVEDFLELHASGGEVCVRLYERKDGTILTADCPVGLKRRRTRAILLATLGTGACALFGFSAIAAGMMLSDAMRPPPPLPERIVVTVPGPTQTVYLSPPIAPAPVIPSSYVELPNATTGTSWVLVRAPEGTRIYERTTTALGKRFLGTAPLVITMTTAGDHSLQAEGVGADGKKWVDTRTVSLASKSATDKTEVEFSAPSAACPLPRDRSDIKGKMSIPKGGSAKGGSPSPNDILMQGMMATDNTL